jgi:hypothetical protein
MAVVVPFIPYIAAAISAVAAISQMQAAKSAANKNAQIAERNAGIAREQAARDAEAQGRTARQKIGAARAAYGAAGVTQEGSPLDVLSMSAANAELDKQNILYRGELRGMGYEDTAELDRQRASAATAQGIGGAASAVLTGAAKVYSNAPSSTPGAQTGYSLGDYNYDMSSYG